MKYSIDVITRLSDNGDGGYTMYGYNSEEELLADHPLTEDGTVELTEEQKEDILNEEDPYENGYIGSERINIEIIDGVARLAKPLHIHAGQ